MTGSPFGIILSFSIFTIALLKDTGYYTDVNSNFSDDIYWGKNKGCDFLVNLCNSNTKFPEFAK